MSVLSRNSIFEKPLNKSFVETNISAKVLVSMNQQLPMKQIFNKFPSQVYFYISC